MEQRQGTIDQHFRVRKRKYGSPSKSPVSGTGGEFVYEGGIDQSPVKKGSLEGFVVSSKRRDGSGALSTPVSQPTEASTTVAVSGAALCRTDAYSHSSSQETPDALKAYLRAFETRVDHTSNGPAEGAPKTDAAQTGANILGNVLGEIGDGDAEEQRIKPISPGTCAVYARRKQKVDPGTEDADIPQLTQFASDFLSNYFSVLPSSDAVKNETFSAEKLSKKRKDGLDLDNFCIQKKPYLYSSLTKASKRLESEKETQKISEQLLCTRIDGPGEESGERQGARHFETGEASQESLEVVSLADSQSICASPVDLKSTSENAAMRLKVSGTPSEVVLTDIIPSESVQETRHDGNIAPFFGSKMNTPIVKLNSMDNPSNHGGRRLRTPQTFALQRGPSPSNVSGGLYRSSLFSPGDDFWDEAIEVAGSLLSSKVDVVGFTQKRRALENQGQVSRTELKNSSSGITSSGQAKVGANGQNLEADAKRPARGTTDLPLSNIVSSARTLDSVNIVGVALSDVQERVSDLNLQTRSYEGVPKSVKDGSGRVGGWLKHLGAKAVSPLPVRHFDFSGSRELHDLEDFPLPCGKMEKHIEVVAEVGRKESAIALSREHNVVSSGTFRDKLMGDHVDQPGARLNTALEVDSNVLRSPGRNCKSHGTMETQRQGTAEVPGLSELSHLGAGGTTRVSSARIAQEKSLELSAWVPEEVAGVYAKKGLNDLYPWQMECLQVDGVLEGKNLIYSASTSAGKSLVAELLMVNRIIATGRMALFVLPFISICSEKAEHLEAVMEPLGKRVGNYFGTQGSATLPRDISIAVCTIEKANSLVNKLLEEGRLSEIGMIVIDELHMVGDRERGYLLELLLTKIRFACGEIDHIHGESQETVPVRSSPFQRSCKGESRADLQIVGMSATMPNISAVAHWLKAALYVTDFRPVPLEEFIKVGSALYNRNMEIVRNIRKGADFGGKDPDHVVELCHEVVRERNSVLVFCSSRKACETSALHIAKYLPPFAPTQRRGPNGFSSGAEAAEELRKSASGLDPVLAVTLPAGVAYHHAGLTMEEREVVEKCFKQGVVRVLTATSTLAAGVNLPARRVIFRQPKVGRDFLDGTRYRQMAGRAGRAGIDTKGESVCTQYLFSPRTLHIKDSSTLVCHHS